MATLANRNNNPGNLRFIGQTGASQGQGGFAAFNTPEEGYAALLNDLQAKLTGNSRSGLKPESTLVDFTKVYAPASDNNAPGNYAAAIANKLGIRPDATLSELQPRIAELAEAVAEHEGYVGQQTAVKAPSQQTGEFNPKPFSNSTVGQVDWSGLNTETPKPAEDNKPKTYLQDIGKNLLERTTQASESINKATTGEINPLSGALQTVGAGAGALGDVVNTSLEHLPVIGKGYKALEDIVGKGAESFFKTEAGQSIANSMSEFQTKNPELSADIGAGFNIVTAIPILKGLSRVKDIAMNTIAKTVAKVTEKKVATALEETAVKGAVKTAGKFLSKNEGIYKEMVSNRILEDAGEKVIMKRIVPDIIEGRYITKDAAGATWENINSLEDKLKQRISGEFAAKTSGGNTYLKMADPEEIANNTLKKMPNAGLSDMDIINNSIALDPMNKNLWYKFASGNATLEEVNQLRSSLGGKIQKVFGQDVGEIATKKEIGEQTYFAISEYIKKEAPETKALFKEISKQFQFQKALNFVNGKNVKTGLLGYLTKGAGVAAGESLGNITGIPMVGAYMGYKGGETATRKMAGGLAHNILSRSSENIIKKGTPKRLGGLLGAALSQKLNK